MSLIHWWPLNGDTKDYITNKLGTLTDGGIVSEDGKIGKCYSSRNNPVPNTDYPSCSDGIKLTGLNLVGEVGDEYSFACWVKLHRDQPRYEATIISSGDWNKKIGWTFGISKAKDIVYCPLDGADKMGPIQINPLENNVWYHLATVYKSGSMSLYVDGKFAGSVSGKGIYQSSAADSYIGRDQAHGGFFPFDGDISDLRIYNHALSQAEISELAKALAVHYTFDDNLIEKTDNRSRAKDWGTFENYWYLSKEKETYKLVKSEKSEKETTVALSNGSLLEEIQVGEIWTVSCYLYKEGKPYKTSETSISPYTWQITGIKSESREDGYFSCTFRVDSKNGAFIIHSRLFGDSTTNPVGTKCEIRYLQFEKRDHATVFTSSIREGILHNEVGYVQPKVTELENVITTRDAVTGSSALVCNGTSIVTPLVADINQGVTISCWAKVLEYPTSPDHNPNQVIFADTNSKLAFGFYNNTEAIISCADYSTAKITNFQKAWMGENNALEKEWHHIVVTRDKEGATRCWLNGLELTERGTSNHWSQNKEALIIGTRYNSGYGPHFSGYIDDFRVYQTLLSESDILDLYKTKGYISNNNDLITNEFIEEAGEQLVIPTCQISARNYQEIGNDEYKFIEYIESTGNQYIDTEHYWTSEKATIVADLEIVSNSSNQSLFGNEERGGTDRYFAHILHGAKGNFNNYIGTGSQGSISLGIGQRAVIEYATYGLNNNGKNSYSFRATMNGTTTTLPTKEISGTIMTRQNTSLSTIYPNTGHIFIFSNNNSASTASQTNKIYQPIGGMKLYGFTMIDNNICVRDFKPCLRKKDNTPGLLDMVSGKFYTSPVGDKFKYPENSEIEVDNTVSFLFDGQIQANQLIEI